MQKNTQVHAERHTGACRKTHRCMQKDIQVHAERHTVKTHAHTYVRTLHPRDSNTHTHVHTFILKSGAHLWALEQGDSTQREPMNMCNLQEKHSCYFSHICVHTVYLVAQFGMYN